MRAFALAAAACLTVGQADAAIYKFDFEWTQRSWDPNINDDTVNGGYFYSATIWKRRARQSG